jgi:hypothetical protein
MHLCFSTIENQWKTAVYLIIPAHDSRVYVLDRCESLHLVIVSCAESVKATREDYFRALNHRRNIRQNQLERKNIFVLLPQPMINSSHRITIGYAVQIKDHSSIHNFRNRLSPIYHLPSTIQTQADSFLRQRQLPLIGTWQLSSFAIREKQT